MTRPARDGGSTTLELVIVFPVVLTLIAAVVQGGVYWHARNVAQAAAREGVTAGQVETGSAAGGQARAEGFAASAGGGLLTDVEVDASRSPSVVVVTVRGRTPSLLPGVQSWTVEQSASGPVERFRSP